MGCHFLLQYMKSESEVAQSCLTLSDPVGCSPPGSSSVGFSRQEYWSGLPLPSPAYSSTYLQNVYRIQPLLSLSKTPGPSPHHILPGSLEQPNDGCPCLCPCSLQFAMADIPKDIIMNEQDKVPCLLKSHFFFFKN